MQSGRSTNTAQIAHNIMKAILMYMPPRKELENNKTNLQFKRRYKVAKSETIRFRKSTNNRVQRQRHKRLLEVNTIGSGGTPRVCLKMTVAKNKEQSCYDMALQAENTKGLNYQTNKGCKCPHQKQQGGLQRTQYNILDQARVDGWHSLFVG